MKKDEDIIDQEIIDSLIIKNTLWVYLFRLRNQSLDMIKEKKRH